MTTSNSDRESSSQHPTTEAEMRAAIIGDLERVDGPITLVDHDPEWPLVYNVAAEQIRAILGGRVRQLEHIGSTSVPGLAAKPIIDIDLVVDDSSDESAYVPAMEAIGYILRVREPDWHEHRMFIRDDPRVQVHVFSVGCPEIERMLAFRDRLRTDDGERLLYERTKRELAGRAWDFVQHYADAKGDAVEAILARAMPQDPR